MGYGVGAPGGLGYRVIALLWFTESRLLVVWIRGSELFWFWVTDTESGLQRWV
jgi:hypothetical protein